VGLHRVRAQRQGALITNLVAAVVTVVRRDIT
jgi:hypothetical protein